MYCCTKLQCSTLLSPLSYPSTLSIRRQKLGSYDKQHVFVVSRFISCLPACLRSFCFFPLGGVRPPALGLVGDRMLLSKQAIERTESSMQCDNNVPASLSPTSRNMQTEQIKTKENKTKQTNKQTIRRE